jgi:hypothetical protein
MVAKSTTSSSTAKPACSSRLAGDDGGLVVALVLAGRHPPDGGAVVAGLLEERSSALDVLLVVGLGTGVGPPGGLWGQRPPSTRYNDASPNAASIIASMSSAATNACRSRGSLNIPSLLLSAKSSEPWYGVYRVRLGLAAKRG